MIYGDILGFMRPNSLKRGAPGQKQWYDQYCAISGKRCEIGCKLVLLTNKKSHIRAFNWYQNQWPWMTLNGAMTPYPRYLCGSWASCLCFCLHLRCWTQGDASAKL